MMEPRNVVIIGTGPAGLTAAIYTARAGLQPLLFSGMEPGGQLTATTEIENFPGFPEGAAGMKLMMDMEQQAKRFGAEVIGDVIEAVDFSSHPLKVKPSGDDWLGAHIVIIASGARARMLNLPGEKKYFGGGGISTCATCDGFFYRGKRVAVVGGGDSACEEAGFLTRFAEKVFIIHRRDALRASKIMQQRTFDNDKIEVLWNKIPIEFTGADKLAAVKLKDTKTDEESRLEVEGFFYAIGHVPNTDFLKDAIELDEQGFVVVDEYQRTSVEGVFAAGDVHDRKWRQAITAAGSGCAAALAAERQLTEKGLA